MERFERQPDLRLAVADGGKFVDTVESSILPPWPCDADRVVANEVKRLRRTIHADDGVDTNGRVARKPRCTRSVCPRLRGTVGATSASA